ncbi:hypothetical protein HYX07_04805 [Candidatus Woesearchaeota archaeon]|nr:hypothetical protein [Candidatus Woesearchaeota archaeon]
MLKNNKAQTTIFMIAGLLIIIGGVIFFYSTQKVPTKFEPEIRIVQEQVPLEFNPVKDYANACAYSVAEEGLKIIGKQGGYISLTDKSLNKEAFSITDNPTESEAVSFAKESELKIPYWWHLKSANGCKGDCKFASKRPELRTVDNSIEKQLERYIDLKFKDCLNDFEPFAEQGFKIIEAGKIKSDVTIGTEDVIVLVNYPLNIERQDAKTRISQFTARMPVNLEKIYELGTKITNMQAKHRYIEKHVLNLLVAFSGVDKSKLPPMSDMQFKFGSSTSWRKSDIKSKVTGLLISYIPLFQVDGTYNYERNTFDSELKQRLYDSTIIPVANTSFKDLSAQFTYLDFWPVHFDLNCKGENCIPSSTNSIISFFGIQQYRFAYDLSFPVLVELQDPFAFNGRGYAFNFFLEGNIRNNKPMPVDFVPLERAALSERSLLCDARTSGNVTVAVASAATRKPVDGANILFTVTDESCFIGSTSSEGTLQERFPVAVGGMVNVVKDGYVGKVVEFDPQLKADSSLKIEIFPLYRKKLIVKKKSVVKTPQGWQFSNVPSDLGPKESATVTLTRANGEGELDSSSVEIYEGLQEESAEIEVAPGIYTADISLVLDERIIIPEKQKCFKKGIFGEKECFTIPRIDFGEKSAPGQEKFPSGGLKMNITLNANELEKYGTMVLYAVSVDIANVPEQNRVIEDTDQINKIEEYSQTYQLALQPTFQ